MLCYLYQTNNEYQDIGAEKSSTPVQCKLMMSDAMRVLQPYESPNGMNQDPLSAAIIGHPGPSHQK